MKVLIIGDGIAGMSAAIEAAELEDEVVLVAPFQPERTQSVMAAGGINAAIDTEEEEDSPVWHANDTLESGCFLEQEEDVRNFCEKAPEHIKWLDEMGVIFDRNPDETLKVRAFGGQSRKRTVYAGTSTGKQIVTAMAQKCLEYEIKGKIEKKIGWYFYSALLHDGKCYGALFYNPESELLVPVYADAVICATGGMNRIYGKTTGSKLCDGYVTGKLFLQGVKLRNLEFIQYHPTTIETEQKKITITEAVRGEGGRLYYRERSKRVYFMEEKYGAGGNLMPRDIVAREIAQCPGQVYLDISFRKKQEIHEKLEEVYELCRDYLNLDITKEAIPVTPAIHFFMGGIKVDAMHRTNMEGLYAVGEAASKYHGANCLGGNSLMAAVHSGRTAAHAAHDSQGQLIREELFVTYMEHEQEKMDRIKQVTEYRGKYSTAAELKKIAKIMNFSMDVVREGEVLQDGIYALNSCLDELRILPIDLAVSVYENYRLYPMAMLGKATLLSALERRESRGAHFRKDFPKEKVEFQKCSVAEYKNGKIRIYFEQESGEKGGAVKHEGKN